MRMINLPNNLFIIVDIIVLLLYIINIVQSYKNGFIYGCVSLFCLILSIWGAWFLSPIFAEKISLISQINSNLTILSFFGLDVLIDTIIWFVILFILINIVIAVLKPVFKFLTKIPLVGPINKILGVIIGVINATIITLILSVIIATPLFSNGKDIKAGTCLNYISSITNKVTEVVYDKAIEEFADKYKFDADEQRENLKNWLVEQGIFDE